MNYRPSDSLKPIAKELARLIRYGSNTDSKGEGLLNMLSGKMNPAPPPAESVPEVSKSGTIGIWKKDPAEDGTCYTRDAEKQMEWALWANTNQLHPKDSKRRIVLLGESVARGYLYDPYYNVAKELEAILNGMRETSNSEVVDLARTGLSMRELQELARSCIALEPDIVVIFAGNNWDPDLLRSFNEQDVCQLFETFRASGFEGLKQMVDRKFSGLVSGFLKEMISVFAAQSIPVVYVIPEFNLSDWKSDHIEQGLLWLPQGKMEEWFLAKERADEGIESDDPEKLRDGAAAMVAANPSNPLGYELLGSYYADHGQPGEARKFLKAARDTVLFTGGVTKPRCYEVIRECILVESEALGIKVVDLPAVFQETFPGRLPDRKLFLDYCHLTVDGIKVAMQHTASRIRQIVTGKPVSAADVRASVLYPERHIQAIAHFGAAIHNAHNGQPTGIIQYHCNKAASFSPKIKDTMFRFSDFSTRRASTFFCKTFEEIISDGGMRQYEGGLLSLAHPKGRKLMDIELVDAIGKAFAKSHPEQEKEIHRLRMNEHGIDSDGVNLIESFYSTRDYNEFTAVPKGGFLQYRSTASYFHFVADRRPALLAFDITYRTPQREYSGKYIEIFINGRKDSVAALPMKKGWCKYQFTIESTVLNEGVNRLVIVWPYTQEPLKDMAEPSLNAVSEVLYPVLGEISSFIVKAEASNCA